MGNARRTQSQRSAESSEKIIKAAIAVIAHQGLDRLAIEDVAIRAGVSRGLPRHYFVDRSGLIRAAAERLLLPPRRSEKPGLAGLLELLERMLRDGVKPTPELRARIALIASARWDRTTSKLVGGHLRQVREAVEFQLHQAITLRDVQADTDKANTARVLVSAVQGRLAAIGGPDGQPVSDSEIAGFLKMVKGLAASPRRAPTVRPTKAADDAPMLDLDLDGGQPAEVKVADG